MSQTTSLFIFYTDVCACINDKAVGLSGIYLFLLFWGDCYWAQLGENISQLLPEKNKLLLYFYIEKHLDSDLHFCFKDCYSEARVTLVYAK